MRSYKILSIVVTFMLLAVLGGQAYAQSIAGYGAVHPYELELQALKGKDKTDVYMKVTSTMNSYQLPNEYKKVQLKSFTSSGKLRYTKNISVVEAVYGVGKIILDDVERFQPIEAEVHIKNEDTVNEKIVSGQAKVLLRPDLVVDHVEAPKRVNANIPFSITAVLKEVNGDLGANSTVSIYDGDKLLDSAAGVVVPAGESKAVAFMVTLMKVGTYTLKVHISAVKPGEYDTSNNDAAFTVEAIANQKMIQYDSDYMYTENYTWNEEKFHDTANAPYYSYKSNKQYENFSLSSYTPDHITPSGFFQIKIYSNQELVQKLEQNDIFFQKGNNGYQSYTKFYPKINGGLAIYQSPSGTIITFNRWAGSFQYSYNWYDTWKSYQDSSGQFIRAKKNLHVVFDLPSNTGVHYGGEFSIPLKQNDVAFDQWTYDSWTSSHIHDWGNYTKYEGSSSGEIAFK